jgi:hypothetical protein
MAKFEGATTFACGVIESLATDATEFPLALVAVTVTTYEVAVSSPAIVTSEFGVVNGDTGQPGTHVIE